MSDGGCSICYTIRYQTKSDVAASIIELQFVLRLPIIDHLLGVIGFYLKWNWLLWPLGALLWYHWLASSVHWLPLSVIGLLQSHLAAIMSAIKAFWEVSIQTFIMLQWTVWCHYDWRWQSENYLLSLSAIGNIQSSTTSRTLSAGSVSGNGCHWL
jgi:hypothetical protein